MKATEAVREIMHRGSIKVATLAGRLGIKSNVLSERLSQQNISVAKLNEMLRAMDYKIVIMPREARVPEDGIEVE